MDITIKEVPLGAEVNVKRMAMIAIERFLKTNVKPTEAIIKTFENSIDTILVANALPKKYDISKEINLEEL